MDLKTYNPRHTTTLTAIYDFAERYAEHGYKILRCQNGTLKKKDKYDGKSSKYNYI